MSNPDGTPAPPAAARPDLFASARRLLISPLGLFGLVLVYVLYSRLWNLAGKVMHHDESLFAYYGYWLYKGRGYDYQPILHGPVLQYVSAFFFLLFGDDQWTMRLPNLVGGLLMFPVAWHWRRYLGGGTAALVGVTALIALSPSIAFYARFLRNDVPYLAVTMWCGLCLLRLFDTGRPLYLWGSIMAAALAFSMMESSIFFFAACLGYLTTMILMDHLVWRKNNPDTIADQAIWPEWLRLELPGAPSTAPHPSRAGTGKTLVLAGVLAAGGLALLSWLYWRIFLDTIPLWEPILAVTKKLGLQVSQRAALALVGAGAFAGLFLAWWLVLVQYRRPTGRIGFVAWFSHALWRNRWHVLAAVAVAVIAYQTLFTTFFTFVKTASFDHGARDFTGPERALTPVQIYKNTWDYWWDQHKLHRIKGPFHYYVPILLLYELPIIALVISGWMRSVWDSRRRWALCAGLVGAHVLLGIVLALWPITDWEMMDKKFHLESPAHIFMVLLFAQLLLVIAPLLFLQHRRAESFITYWGVTSLFAYSYAGEKVPWLTVHTVGPFALLATAELVRLWRRVRPAFPTVIIRRRRRAALVGFCAVALAGVIYQVRNNHLVLFVHPWSPAERLVYNHTSPDVEKAVEIIRDLGEKTNFGVRIPVFMEGEVGWPLHWYLRDYANITPGVGESVDTTTRPVVMVDWHMAGVQNLQENYTLRRMKVREWWEPPMLDFGALTDVYMVFGPRESQRGGVNLVRYQAMKQEWRKLWHYLAYREIWIDPQRPDWSNGANEFCLAIRNDISEHLLTYPWLAATLKRLDVPVSNGR